MRGREWFWGWVWGWVILSGCSSASTRHCATSAWDQVGAQDADRMRPPEYVLRQREFCGAERVNEKAYDAGYVTEMKNLCRVNDAFVFAYSNRPKNPYCTETADTKAATAAGEEYHRNVLALRALRTRHGETLEREKNDEAAHTHDGLGRSILHSLTTAGRSDSEVESDRIAELEERQDGLRRDFAGALIRVRYLEGLGVGYLFSPGELPVEK